MSRRTSRRDFLKQSAATGLGFWVAGSLSRADSQAAKHKLNVACIGIGGKGSGDCDQVSRHANVVAICDIDERYLDKKTAKLPQAKRYNDFRKMLEEMDKQIDAVTVSTPDHTHAAASMMAMKMGKHVYCQKPLTHTVYEARLMRETAEKSKVATQMGNQGTASNGLRQGVEMIQSGVIGPVREVHIWTNRPIWPQAPKITARPKDAQPVPSYLHWDLWLGPAPTRPYHEATYHPFNWRGWWDFGTGALGDMGCHTANLPFMALKLGHPTSIVAENGDLNPETYPGWAIVRYDFPARGDMPPVRVTWYEGHRDGNRVLPPAELTKAALKTAEGEKKLASSGSLMVGDKGILFSPDDYGEKYQLLPEADFKRYQPPAPTLPRNGWGDEGMKIEWLKACQGGKPAMSNFNYAGMLAEFILLGNVAIRAGKKIQWDGPRMRITNDPGAERFLRMEYRSGWTL